MFQTAAKECNIRYFEDKKEGIDNTMVTHIREVAKEFVRTHPTFHSDQSEQTRVYMAMRGIGHAIYAASKMNEQDQLVKVQPELF